jgi:outer membrane protein assembly factor BamB
MATVMLVGAAALAAPWTGGRGPGNRGAFPERAFPTSPAVVWKAFLGPEFVDVMPSNALVADELVIVAYGRTLLGVTTATGEIRWKVEMIDPPLDDLLYLDGQILVTSPNGAVTAYNPENGDVVWKRTLSSSVRNGPTYDDALLFYVAKSNRLEVLARKTGEVKGAVELGDKIEAGVLFYDKSIILGYYEGRISRVESGVPRWSANIPNAVITNTPVTDGRAVLVTTTNALFSLNVNDRTTPIRWTYPCSDRLPDPPVLDNDRIFITGSTGKLYCVDLASGRDRWGKMVTKKVDGKEVKELEPGFPLPATPVAAPLVINDGVLVRMEQGLIALYGRDAPEVIWTYRMKSPQGAPVPTKALAAGGIGYAGDAIFFAGTDGQLYHLSSAAVDVDAPRFTNVLPAVSAQGFLEATKLDYVGAVIDDEGAGMDRRSVTMRLDTMNLTESVQYDANTGYYYVGLNTQAPLEPGMHRLVMTAKDFRGNTGTLSQNFILGFSAHSVVMPLTITGEVLPKHLKVLPGTILRWTNKSGGTRTLVADTQEFADEYRFNADLQYPDGLHDGDEWVWIVPAELEVGTKIYYHCRLHGKPGDGTDYGTGLVGMIEVGEPERAQPTMPGGEMMPGGEGIPGMPGMPGPGGGAPMMPGMLPNAPGM